VHTHRAEIRTADAGCGLHETGGEGRIDVPELRRCFVNLVNQRRILIDGVHRHGMRRGFP